MIRSKLSVLIASAAVFSSQAVAAQNACVEPQDAADAIVYMMPAAHQAALRKCSGNLGEESFLPSAAAKTFISSFEAQQDERWPGTFRFFKVFIEQQDEGDADQAMSQMIASLPESAIRPFIDGILVEIVAGEIKPSSCEKIDRVLELLSPLPADNVGGLSALLLDAVGPKNPPICATKPAESAAE